MWNENGQNQMLDASDIAYMSGHNNYPGETGANELSGGDPVYARVAITKGAASARSITIAGTPSLNVPDYEDFAWFGFWDAAAAGNCRAILPAGGTEMEYCLDISTDTITTAAAHSLMEDDSIVFFPNAPGGITPGTIYYAVNVTTTTFQVSDAPSDYPLDLTSQPSQPAVVSLIVVDDAANGQRVIALGPNATLHNAF